MDESDIPCKHDTFDSNTEEGRFERLDEAPDVAPFDLENWRTNRVREQIQEMIANQAGDVEEDGKANVTSTDLENWGTRVARHEIKPMIAKQAEEAGDNGERREKLKVWQAWCERLCGYRK